MADEGAEKTRKEEPVPVTTRSNRWWQGILVGAAGLALAATLWFRFDGPRERSVPFELPDLPDLTGQPEALVAHLREADRVARERPRSADAVGALGMAYHADNFYAPAARCYALAGVLNDLDWRWKYYEALLIEELGASGSADDALRRAVALNPNYPAAWFRLGEAALKQRLYEEAKKAYEQALSAEVRSPSDRPGRPEPRGHTVPIGAYASLGLARLALEQGQTAEGSQILEGLVNTFPAFGPAHRLLGRAYQELGRAFEAEVHIARAASYPPYHPPADPMVDTLARMSCSTSFLLKQVGVARQSQNGPWAEYLARRALEINGEDPDAVSSLGLLLLDLKRPDDALPHLRRYLDLAGDDSETLVRMGYGLAVAGKLPEAVFYVQKALAARPESADAHNALSYILARQGKRDEAIAHGVEALQIKPDDAQAHTNLADFLNEQGKFDEAIKHYQAAIGAPGSFPKAHNGLGRLLAQQGNVAEARRQLEQALQIRPDYEEAHNNLGVLLAQQGGYAEARGHLERALQIRPDYEEAHNNLGRLLAQQGKVAEARGHLERALQIRPDYAEAHNNLGVLLAQQGGYAEARGHLERALQIQPDYAEASHNLGRIAGRD